jgi:hypothetical protein
MIDELCQNPGILENKTLNVLQIDVYSPLKYKYNILYTIP